MLFAISANEEARAATLTVPAGSDLQSALNAAEAGDTLILEAGASYIGTFTLPNKSGSSFITIQSSALSSLPAAGVRVSPADAANMPKIVSAGRGTAALVTEAAAHHYKFIGIEFKPVDQSAFIYNLINLGDGSAAQNSLDKVPHHLTLDRCYIHADPNGELKRGIALDSAETSIINCYIAGFRARGQDSQAIAGYNGPGPFHIINNYLEAGSENILFGGADASIEGLIPSDIEIRGNYMFKPLAWRDAGFVVKNLLELKNAQRVIIDGNILQNVWTDGQTGCAVLFTTRNQDGGNPWATVKDVQFTNNIVRNAQYGLSIALKDDTHASAQGNNLLVRNNLFDDINYRDGGSRGRFFAMANSQDVTIDHNTVNNTGSIGNLNAYNGSNPMTGFVFTNNIVNHSDYGFTVAGIGDTEDNGLNAYLVGGGIVTRNALIGGGTNYGNSFPTHPGNLFPSAFASVGFVDYAGGNYALASGGAYKNGGTDGRDIGVDYAQLSAATANAVSGGGTPPAPPAPTPTPVPTPTPAPTPSYEGYHDGATCASITGWAWDRTQPNAAVSVDIYDGQTMIAAGVVANQYRQDLSLAGKGNGYHAFSIATPARLKDRQLHSITVNVAGTNINLNNTGIFIAKCGI